MRLPEDDTRFGVGAKTQGPSTALRFGRDDRVIAGRHRAGRPGGGLSVVCSEARRSTAPAPCKKRKERGTRPAGRNSSKGERWMRAAGGWLSPDGYPADGDRDASQTRDYCVAKNATHRAARLDPSLRKERLLGMTIEIGPRPLKSSVRTRVSLRDLDRLFHFSQRWRAGLSWFVPPGLDCRAFCRASLAGN